MCDDGWMRRPGKRTLPAAAALLLVAACGGGEETATTTPAAPKPQSGAAPWPAPPDPMARTRAAGLKPERREFLVHHVHAHLDVFVNGDAVPVPAAIGIDIRDPGVKHTTDPSLGPRPDVYGGIDLCQRRCISPLHTHDWSGVLHTESKTARSNTLGQLFTEWGVRLDGSCVGGYCRPEAPIAVYVDGAEYDGNPAQIELTDGKEIAVVIGTPPDEIPRSYDFGP
jgi:hypothetical protein